MFLKDPYSLGIILAAIGLTFWLVSHLLVRVAPRFFPRKGSAVFAGSPAGDRPGHEDAVLTVLPGGRLAAMNPRARQLFNVSEEDTPGLERLARRVRPADQFISLCAAEGKARFVFNGRPLEAVSYLAQGETTPVMLVVLRTVELSGGVSIEETGTSGPALETFTRMAQAMASNLDVEMTVRSILESVEKVLPVDFLEVSIWEAETQSMTTYRFLGFPGMERRLEMSADRHQPGEGYTGYLASEQKPLLIPDVHERKDLRPLVAVDLVPLRSYLGFPLMAGDQFTGTLELGSMTPDFFGQDDMELIRLVAGQAAVSVHNALLFRSEQRRSAELSGLAQLAQAFSSLRDSQSLFARLVQSIVPLVHVEILGFLLYNENQRMLEGQIPYYGVPSQFMELYHVPIPLNSQAEELLINQQPFISSDALNDLEWRELGWSSLAEAANLRETAFIPLTSSGRMIGYLQASNHVDGLSPFRQDELHLLTIVANQAAPIIENATLVQQTRLRAQRAEALGRVASLASSAAHLDEIFLYSLKELAHLLHADVAGVFLLDSERSSLKFHPSSMYGGMGALSETFGSLPVEDPQYPFTVAGSLRSMNYNSLNEQQAIIPFYQAILSTWSLESAVVAPLVVRDEGIGEVWIGSRKPGFFEKGDLQVVLTAAGALAGVVERSYLVMQTDDSLRRRVDQLTALTRISRELSTSLDLDALVQVVFEEAMRTTQAEIGSILLFEMEHPDSPFVHIRMVVGDHPGTGFSPVEALAIENQESILVPDFASSEFSNPREGIQSALVVPILYQQRTAGLIVLQAHSDSFFTAESVEVIQSLATQASAAIGNAIQYEQGMQRVSQLRRELDTLARLVQVSQQQRPDHPIEDSLRLIGEAVRDATPFKAVLLSLYEPESATLRRVVGIGISPEVMDDLEKRRQPWSAIDALQRHEYRVGNAYFVPIENDLLELNSLDSQVINQLTRKKEAGSWHPEDILMVPLYDANGKPLGLISLDAPADGARPDRATLEALDLFGIQASVMIENYFHINGLFDRTAELEQAAKRLQQSLNSAQKQMPMLLHSNLEQTMTIQKLDRQVQHIRTGLEIGELAGRQKDAAGVLRSLAREMLARFGFGIALIAEPGEHGPHLCDVFGNVPAGVHPEALFGQRNPLRQAIEDRRPLIVNDIDDDSEWKNNPLLTGLEVSGFIALPLSLGNERTAGVLICGERIIQAFTREDQDVFIQLAGQVSVALQNMEFLNETRRRLQEVNLLLAFNRKLAGLDPGQILQALVDSLLQMVPNARAGWAARWNAREGTLVPSAAAGYMDAAGMLAVIYPRGTLPARVLESNAPQRVEEVHFAQDYSLSSNSLMHYRQGTGGNLPVSSLVVPVSRGELPIGVVVLDHFNLPAAFSQEDEDLAVSLAQQAALALENASLFSAAGERAAQLQALTRVVGTLTSSLKTEELVQSLLGQLQTVLSFETATLWLQDGDVLSIADTAGFKDVETRVGIRVTVADSRLFQEMVRTQQPIAVADVRKDDRFSSLLEPACLSWMGIPLISKSQLIGAIALEKKEVGYYSPADMQIAATFASQAAVALENARLFEESQGRAAELDQRSRRLALLNRLSEVLGSSLEIDTILKLTGRQLIGALNSSLVSVIVAGEGGGLLLQVELPETGQTLPVALPKTALFDHLLASQGIFTAADVTVVPDLAPLQETFFEPRGIHSLLALPLLTGLDLYGWLLVMHEEPARFSLAEIELARTMCNQSAIAIQNALLFAETRRLTGDLERRVEERTIELRHEHQNTETLLNIITELSTSLDLNQVMNRTLGILNQSLHVEKTAVLLSDGKRRYQAGAPGTTGRLEGSQYEQEIANWVVSHRSAALVGDLGSDQRWTWETPPSGSVLAVPLVIGEEVLGALLLFHSQESFFIVEQVSLIEAVARQISVALNNAELFTLIRDQAEHMGSLLRDQQIEASRSRAILEAVADGVLVTDEEMNITLFNASAERILGLAADIVINHPLDEFSGLFGKAALTWMQTIRAWSEDPALYQGEAFSEQISLDQQRVVSVHLAPVIWRSQLLGTVSIFRDITHEVQVDRLKSEFVANVSHELRTPMTSIQGYVDIILMGAAGPISSQVSHFLTIVRRNTERLSILVNDLLDISRIEAGRVVLDLQPVNLLEIAEEVINDVQRRSREENKPMQFEVTCDEALPRVNGDPDRVRQILGNLVMNGYNYTPADGRVQVKMTGMGEDVQVDVIDSGIGIAPKDHERIFQRFYRGEDPLVLKTAGTGLGLTLSKTLVEMHQGRIWFKSTGEVGEGSTFSFTLPVNPEIPG
jgi:PAS domain S-box-containing protein